MILYNNYFDVQATSLDKIHTQEVKLRYNQNKTEIGKNLKFKNGQIKRYSPYYKQITDLIEGARSGAALSQFVVTGSTQPKLNLSANNEVKIASQLTQK